MYRIEYGDRIKVPLKEPTDIPTQTWDIDPDKSYAHFSIRHMVISKVRGGFSQLSGNLLLNKVEPTKSTVSAIIDARSIDTQDAHRDEYLKSADFLNVEKYPSITFHSRQFRFRGPSEATITGDLTIREVTKEVILEIEDLDSECNLRLRVCASTKIKRGEFGLTWSAALEAGNMMVGDEITITLELLFQRYPQVHESPYVV